MGRDQKRTYRSFFGAYGRTGPWVCGECGQLVYRHGTRRGDGNIHHKDEDVTNDDPSNLVMIHTYCHRRKHMVGVERSDDVRRRIGQGHIGVGLGRQHSDETRRKISAAMQEVWQRRRLQSE